MPLPLADFFGVRFYVCGGSLALTRTEVDGFSSSEPLGLQSELIVYPSSRRPSVVHHFQRSSLKPLGQSKPHQSQNLCAAYLEGGIKVYINGPGHMTEMAAMPIYGKTFKLFSRTRSPMI